MFPNLNPMEMMVVFGVAVLLFGKRLPEVGRSLGKGIVEFKKGLRGVENEFRAAVDPLPSYHETDHRTSSSTYTPEAPKFEAPVNSPVPQMEYEPHPSTD